MSLTAGDESNAVVEALDSVNLMTVHAAKGLEFPIVFLVNLAKGASGPPHPVRVIVDGDSMEPSVTVGRFRLRDGRGGRERERHETRRLLYVALTRARDRLYLSSTLKEAALRPGRGSLAEVLPESFRPLFARATGAFEGVGTLAWRGASGTRFEFRLCDAALGCERREVERWTSRAVEPERDLLGPQFHRHDPSRTSVIGNWVCPRRADDARARGTSALDRVLGALIHRLLHRVAWGRRQESREVEDVDSLLTSTRDLLTPEERASAPDVESLVRSAVDGWRRLIARPELATHLAPANGSTRRRSHMP